MTSFVKQKLMKHYHYETETVSLCIVFFLMSIKAFDYLKIISKCQLFLRTITKQTKIQHGILACFTWTSPSNISLYSINLSLNFRQNKFVLLATL